MGRKHRKKHQQQNAETPFSAASSSPLPSFYLSDPFVLLRQELPSALGVGLLSFVAYVLTMLPTVSMEDSGEFIAAANLLGVAHPPGYPLFTLIGHLFSYIPLGSPAYRIHLMNGLFGAFTASGVYLLALSLTQKRVAALTAALALSFSQSFWFQSIISEVYMLNALLFVAMLLLLVKLEVQWNKRTWQIFALVYGLSLANHWPLIILATPALMIWLYPQREKLKTDGISGAFALFLGLFPYLYIWMRANSDTSMNFIGPISNFQEFWEYLTRKFYERSDNSSPSDMSDRLKFVADFFKSIPMEFTWLGAALSGLGVYAAWKSAAKHHLWALLAALASSSILLQFLFQVEFSESSRDAVAMYQMIPLTMAALFIAYGIVHAERWIAETGAGWLLGTLGAALVTWNLFGHWSSNNLKNDTFAYDFAVMILNSLPENATMLTRDDTETGPMMYANMVEGVRPDVEIYSQKGVFSARRMFDARKIRDAYEAGHKMVEFVRKKNVVYSTQPLAYEKYVPSAPWQTKFNGLYFEISQGDAVRPIPDIAIKQAIAIADRIQAGGYGTQWPMYRDNMIGSLCLALNTAQLDHPLFESHRNCQLIRGRQLASVKKYGDADRYLTEAMEQSRPLVPKSQLSEMYFEILANRVQLINSKTGSLEEKKRELAQLADFVLPGALIYPQCENKVVGALVALRRQANIPMPVEELRQRFGSCPAYRGAF